MKNVQIIKGTYGHRPINADGTISKSVKPVTAKDAPISVRDEEAVRLEGLGVGKVVIAEETIVPAVATAVQADAEDTPGVDPAQAQEGAEGVDEDAGADDDQDGTEEGVEIPEYSMDWSADDLRALVNSLGLPGASRMNKTEMVAALDAAFDGGELEVDEE